MLILDLWWGISFLAVVVFGLGKNLSFKSILGCWETFDKGFLTAFRICRGIRNLRIYEKDLVEKEKEDAFNRKFVKSQIYHEKKVQRLLLYLSREKSYQRTNFVK